MSTIQGKRVSRDWFTVLSAAQRHVRFQLNSGQRTLDEQRALYNCWREGRCSAIAAVPSCNSPHIRCARQAHALDVQCGEGHNALVRWLEKHVGHVSHTVKGECWHIEVSEADLKRAASRIRRAAGLRLRYNRVKASIARRAKRGQASPGQRKLLARIRRALRKVR